MTTPDLAALQDRPVHTLDDLTLLWRGLMGTGGFGRRSLWLVFLDHDGVPARVVMPIEDIPVVPAAADLSGLRRVLEQLGVPSVAMLLSRPGGMAERDSDRRWAAAVAPLSPWPLHLATADDHDPDGPTVVRRLSVG